MAADAVLSYERTGDGVALELRGLDGLELTAVLCCFWCALQPDERVAMVALLANHLRDTDNAPPPEEEEEMMDIIHEGLIHWQRVLAEVRRSLSGA